METVRIQSGDPLFSIVTPAYNAEKLISKAFESIKKQTFNSYEMVIVNDGSSDNTEDEIKKLIADNPQYAIKMVSYDQNRGIGYARNAGLHIATGKYVCFLDADDYWLPNKLEMLKKEIESNPNFTVYYHWVIQSEDDGKKQIIKLRQINNANALEDLLFEGNSIAMSGACVIKEAVDKINGFDEKLKAGTEDYDFWIQLAEKGASYHLIEEPLGVYCYNPNGISKKYKAHVDEGIYVIKRHAITMMNGQNKKQNSRTEHKLKKISAVMQCSCGRRLALTGDTKGAFEYYRKAVHSYPLYFRSYAGILLNIIGQ